MSISDAETLGLGSVIRLEPPPRNSTGIEETLTSEFNNLKLEEKAEAKSEEAEEKAEDERPADENLVASGWDEEIIQETSWDREIIQETNEVKGDGWGWDQEFTGSSEGNQKKDFEPSVDKKFDGWGWDQGNGGGEEDVRSKEGKGQKDWFPFPVRSSEPDCAYYMKTGTCKYGANCRFNHPPSKMRGKVKFRNPSASVQAVELIGNGTSSVMAGQTDHEKAYRDYKRGSLSESNGQMDCKYFSMPGGCKYGSACKYNHKEKSEVPAELNFVGLPLRPGEQECTYYMSTGSCKFSTSCRFHHPDPIAVGGQGPSGYQNGGSQPYASPAQLPMAQWPLQRNPTEPIPYLEPSPSYVTGYYLPQMLHANPEWNGYQAPVNPVFPAEMNMLQPPSASTMKDTSRTGNFSTPTKALDVEYPERPGQAECQYFMKTGSCKFKSACKYHHPKSRMSKTSAEVNLNPVGLPLRPDQPTCTHFSRHGICKYGRSCRYNHPMD